jgi:hypothetical protein
VARITPVSGAGRESIKLQFGGSRSLNSSNVYYWKVWDNSSLLSGDSRYSDYNRLIIHYITRYLSRFVSAQIWIIGTFGFGEKEPRHRHSVALALSRIRHSVVRHSVVRHSVARHSVVRHSVIRHSVLASISWLDLMVYPSFDLSLGILQMQPIPYERTIRFMFTYIYLIQTAWGNIMLIN